MEQRAHYSWSKAEEQQVMAAVKQYGRNWSYIMESFFPYLTASQIKYKYYGMLRREDRQSSGSLMIGKFIVDDVPSAKTTKWSTPRSSARQGAPELSKDELIQQIIQICAKSE